jgi:sugar (pentulose or hexulose) kinase
VGIYGGFEEAAARMVKVKEVFEPDRRHVHVYDELFEAQQNAYKALKEANVFGQIAASRKEK